MTAQPSRGTLARPDQEEIALPEAVQRTVPSSATGCQRRITDLGRMHPADDKAFDDRRA
ncbi:hypothetical protein [Actinoplanes sp. NPDC049802]|uniref:hypothetical protein n=1 Tax=Actinoplanes sp. NPDC049802 TaxID=3154742 RepID=UPI0033EA7F88